MDPFPQYTHTLSCEMLRIKLEGNAKLRYLYRNTFPGMLIPLIAHTELSSVRSRFHELALIFWELSCGLLLCKAQRHRQGKINFN